MNKKLLSLLLFASLGYFSYFQLSEAGWLPLAGGGGGGGGITTVYNQTVALSGNNMGGAPSATNYRIIIPPADLSAGTGTQIRVSFLFFGGGDGGYTVGTAYIGQQGASAPNFAGDQVQLKFSTASTFSSLTTATAVVSDFVTLAQAFDATKTYVVSFRIQAIPGNLGGTLAFAGTDQWELASGVDQSSNTTPSTMTFNSGLTEMVSKMEVQ